MLENGASLNYEKGYYGSVVLSFFKTSDSQTGAGRKKRGIKEDGTGVEVELAFRSSSVLAPDIDTMFDSGNITDLIGTSKSSEALCDEATLDYDKGGLVLKNSDSGTVPVGMKAYFDCVTGFVMSRTYDKTKLGLGVSYLKQCYNKLMLYDHCRLLVVTGESGRLMWICKVLMDAQRHQCVQEQQKQTLMVQWY